MNIEDTPIPGFTTKTLIVIICATASVTGSILYGVGHIGQKIDDVRNEFRSQTDTIKNNQAIRAIKNDYNFKEIRADIQHIKEKIDE